MSIDDSKPLGEDLWDETAFGPICQQEALELLTLQKERIFDLAHSASVSARNGVCSSELSKELLHAELRYVAMKEDFSYKFEK